METTNQLLGIALSDIRESLSIAGYELSFEQQKEGILTIQIKAGPDACEECLVPRPILEQMICDVLSENAVSYTKINLHLPEILL